MNKSLGTTLISLACIGAGWLLPGTTGELVLSVGLFATSGAVTNWLAVFMLFEKVPLLYGSGVIPSRFEEFKAGIRTLIMGQFFTRENLARFFSEAGGQAGAYDPATVAGKVDYDLVFDRLAEAILGSSFGGMLAMFGGEKALAPLREPVKEKLRLAVEELLASGALKEALAGGDLTDAVLHRVEGVVSKRLDELTPRMVKEIIQEMIRLHLGWLVVWGGVFGGLMGLVAGLIV